MGKLLSLLILVLITASLHAQSDSVATNDSIISFSGLSADEIVPEYPGGNEEMNKFISKKMKYPKAAIKNKIEGKVIVQFVVERDGTLSNITIAKDIGYGCGEEVIRVMKKMPKWKPGMQKGKNVRVTLRLPITFTLPKEY